MRFILLLSLAEMITCLLFWLLDPMAGYIFTLSVSSVAAALLVIALIAERIEASRINQSYYYGMVTTIVTPLLTWGIVYCIT